MKQAEHKDFRKPDEVREFPKGRVELIAIGGATVGRAVFEPGWKWSTSVQPPPLGWPFRATEPPLLGGERMPVRPCFPLATCS